MDDAAARALARMMQQKANECITLLLTELDQQVVADEGESLKSFDNLGDEVKGYVFLMAVGYLRVALLVNAETSDSTLEQEWQTMVLAGERIWDE